uniref:30S ribosomal protein S6 n=1 Tax=Heterorhabditis bacteriophora TaxID=37862 RepID=A0A1I7X5N3_HETBA
MARWILLYIGQDGSQKNVNKLLQNQHVSRELLSSAEFSKLIGYSKPQQENRTGNEDSPEDEV